MESYTVLPFEGATGARDLYHEACLRTAMEALQDSDYTRAMSYAEKARDWPVNLGSGKPYDTDERMEDHLLYRAFAASGQGDSAAFYAARVMNHVHPAQQQQENSLLYLQLDLLRQNGKTARADSLASSHSAGYPDNKYVLWAVQKAGGNDAAAASFRREIETEKAPEMPYDNPVREENYQLLLDYLEQQAE